MKKRILSLILALSMVLSVLPLGAFAEGSTGDLVIDESGYPIGSNGGKDSCSGNDWEYSNGALYLNLGAFDLSTTEPVKCEIHSFAIIAGGTFEGTVYNYGTISGGIFNGTVTNASTGKISGGTFAGSVTNDGTIENGTFNGSVTNSGNINKGTFNGTVANGGTITGGVFNLNAKPIGVTGGHNITWDAASSKAEIEKVNDVSANWKPYAYAGTTVTITADTEIFSLNGQPIGDGNCKSSYGNDKTTVTFTMPGENVVLSTGELVMAGGYPIGSNNGANNCEGKGWEYKGLSEPTDSGTLILKSGTYNFSLANPQDTTNKTPADSAVACAIVIQSSAKISGGTFEGEVKNYGSIDKGTFEQEVINNAQGTISDGTFNGTVSNSGTITGNGTFLEKVTNNQGGNITNGTFNHTVENDAGGTISNGTFNATVTNNQNGTISNGTFEQEVINNDGGEISGGTFKGTVLNGNAIITGGTFAAGLSRNDGSVTGGAFNGKTGLTTKAHQVTVTNGSVSQVNGVDPRNADGTTGTAWDLYAYKGTTVIITADTEIFSLNGYPISGAYNSSYPYTNNKKIVKFTMPYNENVVLSTGELVMAGGYPIGSNNGANNYNGKGWAYSAGNLSDPTDTGTLHLWSGTFDFNFADPTTKITRTDSAVACEIQSYATIIGGIFAGSVKNGYTIENGTFTNKVENSGYINNGTFAGNVTNSGAVNGGVFNRNATLINVTGGHNITWDAAYSNAKIEKVNGVSADWAPCVVVTELTKTKEVIITADTDIFSLNGQPIDAGNCNSSYGSDKKTVTFTMPDEDVVLNRTAELTVVDGEIESGETAEGSGRVRIGGKVEVTTKDKTQDFVGWTIAPEGIELRHDDGSAVDLTSERTFSFMMPDVSGGKLTLTANYQPFRTSLLMNADGTVNLEHVNHETYDGNETCKGDGWNVFNRGTLILENGTYDFRYTAPKEKTGTLEAVTCGVRNEGGTIENGVFRNLVLNEVGGTITGGTFAAGLFEMPGMTSGTVTSGVFNGKTGLTNAHHVTVTNGSVLKVNGEDPLKVDETTGAVTTGTAWDLYSYAGTTVTITADTDIFSLNGQPIGTGNCNSSYPDENDKTTVTFTMPDKDVVLNEEINYGDLVMKNGYPVGSNGGKDPCKGDGWEYIKNDPTNGDMLLLTGSNQTGGLYDFSTIGDGSAVECNVFVGKPTAITGGEFNGKVINNSGILGGTFNGEVENRGPGTIEKGTFNGAVENNGIIENGAFNGAVENNGTINDGAFHDEVKNNGTIEKGTFNGAVENNGTIENGAFNGKVENNSAINSGTFNGPVDNTASGTIEKGTFHDSVENKGTINGGTFNGAVTSSGTVSESITGSGTLNGEPITKTPEPEPEPEPEPTTYTVTVIGGTIDGKTSVSAKENDTLTVVLDQSEVPDGMTFDLWSISSSKLSGDINVDYRAEAMTFQMPAEDVTIRAQYRSAEIIEDAAPSPLATAATIAVGGAAAGIVVWQGVNLGVDLYLANALPQGVPVPTDRRALALLLWETAGKPEVALPTLYGDIPAEEIELQKATRWAVQNGLMDAADKKDASFFDPDHYVTKMDVFGAWLRLKKLLGTIGTSPTQ